ncbi:ent-kaurene oxidase [Metarhizium album ARSEF 1941]|uniref:Ent-kaurene oxidase n=1 Tax=Metarhizium album (strain ARSEF 1941) TaxID=1081103 RepID=A0A0B2X4C5_METAS|nr:ent-kaurene oxidase [Metarhizium album ARSEF 1941]KHO00255.1 ent-kaurene oxidase [Metarhizium album ARSEF 1941]
MFLLYWLLIAALGFVLGFVLDYLFLIKYPDELPTIRYNRGLWSHIRSNVGYFTSQKAWIREGYNKYNKKGLPFLAPSGLSRPHDVVLPRSMLPWLREQPESAVDARMAHMVGVYGDYNFLDSQIIRSPFGMRAIQKSLNRSLPGLVSAVDEEVQRAVNSALKDVGDDWTSINLWDMWQAIVPSVTNRMLVGPTLCRDKQFLEAMVGFTHVVLRNCVLLRLSPSVLHPVLGRLLAVSNWIYWRRAYKRVGPVITTRIDKMRRRARGDPELRGWSPPEDYITWLVGLALEEGRASELDPVVISKRLLPIEFAAIDTTVLTGVLWIQDLLKTPSVTDDLTAELRVHRPAPGESWSAKALQSLVQVDSSIRESQRLSNFHLTLVERVVVAPDGVSLPGVGWKLPRGAHITVNMDSSHHDEDMYDDAQTYKALRFSTMRKERDGNPGATADAAKPLGMVSMNDHHFPFGHGKHACPGRFFVAHEMKLIAAHLLLNFDLEAADDAPSSPVWIGAGMMPPFRSRIRVRRKSSSAD